MTRINLVPPAELTDQHLFAEFREIKMMPKSLARSLVAVRKACKDGQLPLGLLFTRIPEDFTLGKGHVSFFYDKGEYLRDRYGWLRFELNKRGVNFNQMDKFDPDGVMLCKYFNQNYVPTPEALRIIRQRIAEKIALKPMWYRYNGVPLNEITMKDPHEV